MTKRVRNRLPIRIEDLWEPQWNDATIGWTKKFIRNNMWRTETINDMEETTQVLAQEPETSQQAPQEVTDYKQKYDDLLTQYYNLRQELVNLTNKVTLSPL